MVLELGPRARRVYMALRDQIISGELPPGTKLPSYPDLAVAFAVAPMTVRQALARLEEDHFITREVGRGTFVRRRTPPAVLIVDDDPVSRKLLSIHVQQAGRRPVEVAGPGEALATLESDPTVVLVLSDVRMPDRKTGVDFIRTVRYRWPDLPFVAITGYPDDLADLHGTPDYPCLTLCKPILGGQIDRLLRLVLTPAAWSNAADRQQELGRNREE
ncbi:MAG: GntR family transcriptional regulator [Chloroflexi bacterium]|nr:GntR family transcriptional regulator [Chloroflexota bacterium]